MLENFTNSQDFIEWIKDTLNNSNAPQAGKAFEQYTLEWHKAFGCRVDVVRRRS